MLSRLIALPFVLGAFIALYLTWETDEGYALYIIPMALILVAIYIFQPQIDWWHYKKNPPTLDFPVIRLLDQYFPFYQRLSQKAKTRFRNRVSLYMLANEFTGKGFEAVPEDVKAIIAANAVTMSFGKENYLMDKFERIFVYPHPFPSPQHPRHLHSSEIFEEDGAILFSAEHLMAGTISAEKYLNVGLYEYAKVFRICFPAYDYPVFDEYVWGKIEAISGFSKEKIEKYIGLPEIDAASVCMTLFFQRPDKFRQLLPVAFESYCEILGINPLVSGQGKTIKPV